MNQEVDREASRSLTIHLFSAPWALFNRPSIQLGALKAYLQAQSDHWKVEAHHFYLKIAKAVGYATYQVVCEKTWPAESVYAALLFPEMADRAEALFKRESKKNAELKGISFEDLARRVQCATDDYLDGLSLDDVLLAGFSVCLCQMTSSLYCIRRLKKRFPNLPMVVGGSNFAGAAARSLLQAFPEVDFVVMGEGELPLTTLVRRLERGDGMVSEPIAGVVSREREHGHAEGTCVLQQLENLAELPVPDYSDYFRMLQMFEPHKRFFPTLVVEASRGCWWRKREGTGHSRGCAFCNLNLQWEGYRSKTPEQVTREVDGLTSRHQVLSLAFADNVVPSGQKGKLFQSLKTCGKDFKIFAEIRAGTPHAVLKAMREAGMEDVQVGIEALCTGLLKKMNKGTTAMDNLQVMRDCEELGIAHASNLLLRFPSSDKQDVEETLRTLEFALPFRPLRKVFFWLGAGSPVHDAPDAFGIRAIQNHPCYGELLPGEVVSRMSLMVQDYKGDRALQKKLWRPVEDALGAWQKSYEKLHGGENPSPILSYRDGGSFLIISHRRIDGEPAVHRLTGSSRAIYLFCSAQRTLADIVTRFPGIGEAKIKPFLDMMVAKKLMYREDDRCMSLAVRLRGSTVGHE